MLERLWRTGEIRVQKPDVRAELLNILHHLRHVFRKPWCNWMIASVPPGPTRAWTRRSWSSSSRFPLLRIGSWVGGDRDGHPLRAPKPPAWPWGTTSFGSGNPARAFGAPGIAALAFLTFCRSHRRGSRRKWTGWRPWCPPRSQRRHWPATARSPGGTVNLATARLPDAVPATDACGWKYLEAPSWRRISPP
ncbi:MAG: phosphoenolpyruvate carboxylase [Fibrobacteres bacterium]|nr:phosphoenolpyruvate carboxylase [Fibrobacterota bacterium]